MKIEYTLNETHKSILEVLYLLGKLSVADLEFAVRLLKASRFDYIELLKNAVTVEVFNHPLLATYTDKTYIYEDGDIEKGVRTLELLDLLSEKNVSREREIREGKYNIYALNESDDIRERKRIKRSTRGYEYEITLTEEGNRVGGMLIDGRKAILRPTKAQRSTIFIACAFGYKEIDQLFEEQLKPACEAVGYTAFRVDLNEPEQTITESILQGITEAECMIADLTFARPSVYFEVGVAHGLGISLILTCREDHYRSSVDNLKVHFDLEQYKISYWSKTRNGFQWREGMQPITRLKSILNMVTDKK